MIQTPQEPEAPPPKRTNGWSEQGSALLAPQSRAAGSLGLAPGSRGQA